MADTLASAGHSHVFLGHGHDHAERRSWAVIWLCAVMMVLEIGGGLMFGSIALVADGLHMSTHAGALLLAALAYSYARRHAEDPRFTFGTGKMGDLAGFSSAIVLAMISLLIAYDAVTRFFVPVPIRFAEAIPIACLGLVINIASVWLLGGGHDHAGHHHNHGHGHAHDHGVAQVIETPLGAITLAIVEHDAPPRFRLQGAVPEGAHVETLRADGSRQIFPLRRRDGLFESADIIPEPHEFTAALHLPGYTATFPTRFEEHVHADAKSHRDNNMRAAVVHVAADAMVSILVIVGLLLARSFGWVWMDPLAGLIGAVVIAAWSYGLIRDTGGILLDMMPDDEMQASLRAAIEAEGDRLTDFHMWRLGPGHLGAILSIATAEDRTAAYYRARLARFRALSHVTIEIE
jgi:cation diffusion facilitator family transporter